MQYVSDYPGVSQRTSPTNAFLPFTSLLDRGNCLTGSWSTNLLLDKQVMLSPF